MEEKFTIRKDRIKNIAIIFLAVMLVLTFFSNSILNHSLPEVATQYVQSGSITQKVRGTGAVVANDPYQVTVKDSRVIASVAVKNGDTVEKGQVLYYLEETESAELKEAQKQLDDLILSYTSSLLSGEISNQSYINVQNGNISSVGVYQAKIEAARQKVETAEETLASLERQLAGVNNSSSIEATETQLATAEKNMNQAEADMNSAKENVTTLEGKLAAIPSNIDDLVNSAVLAEEIAKTEYDGTRETLLVAINTTVEPDITAEEFAEYTFEEIAALASENNAMTQLAAMQEKYDAYVEKKAESDSAKEQQSQKTTLTTKLSKAKTTYQNAVNKYNECKTTYTNLSNTLSQQNGSNSQLKADLEMKKMDAQSALDDAKAEQSQLLVDISSELDLANQNSIIAEKQAEIEKMRSEMEGTTIVAPIAGTVSGISMIAGETTSPDESVATIQPEGKGFTLSFAVTNEQAAKIKVGDAAEVANSWYYDDVKAIVTRIRPDTEEPGKKKLIEFQVEGSVQEGENLSLSVGQSAGDYDVIVPNSAIREDKNGKFVLIINEKRTPFGNRYIAKKVPVEVLASDEMQSAIMSELEGYEYVITTTNKPVEAGDQVRLAEN